MEIELLDTARIPDASATKRGMMTSDQFQSLSNLITTVSSLNNYSEEEIKNFIATYISEHNIGSEKNEDFTEAEINELIMAYLTAHPVSGVTQDDIAAALTTYLSNHSLTSSYPILSHETGVIASSYPYGDVRRYGAKGDGTADDASAIQNAINSNEYIYFEPYKEYKLVSNGLYLQNRTHLIGNNATLFFDDDYAPTNDDFGIYRRFIRCKASVNKSTMHEIFHAKDLIIESRRTKPTPWTSAAEFNILYPAYTKNVLIENVTVNAPNVVDRYHCFNPSSCENIVVLDSTFVNLAKGGSGGALWLHIIDVSCKFYGRNIYCENYCSDETFTAHPVFTDNNDKTYDITVDNSVFKGSNNKFVKRTKLMSFYDTSSNKVKHFRTTFNQCRFETTDDTTIKDYYLQSLVGCGSPFEDADITVTFNDCDINCDLRLCLVSASEENWSGTSTWTKNLTNRGVTFNNTKITTNVPINGTSASRTQSALVASNVKLNNCNVDCKYAVTLHDSYDCRSHRTDILNSIINISSAIACCYDQHQASHDQNFIFGSTITADASISLIGTASSSTCNAMQTKVVNINSASRNILNNSATPDIYTIDGTTIN